MILAYLLFGYALPRWIQEPLVVRDRDGKPQGDPLAVHCFCLCTGSALLGDLLSLGLADPRNVDLPCAVCYILAFLQCLCVFFLTCFVPRAGSGVVRTDLLRFLAGCHARRLNQV